MSSERFNLVFSGELVRGADLAQSKKNLGQLFKISGAKVDALFSGKAVTLKKNLDFATANKYRVAIKKAGCRVDLIEEADTEEQSEPVVKAPPSQPVDTATASSAHDTNPRTSDVDENHSLPSALEKVAADSQPLSSDEPERPPLPVVEEIDPSEVDHASSSMSNSLDLSLAPSTGNLLGSHEFEHPVAVEVDIGGISIRDADGDLLDDEEKTEFVPADIDLDAELAPVGSDLLKPEEKDVIEVPVIDVSELNLAEAGEDLGQLKQKVSVSEPDTSYLSLE